MSRSVQRGTVNHLATRTSSPPKPERLRGVVARQLKRDAALPVLPAAAAELLTLMSSEDTCAKELSDVIHRDQALAAHVLRIANTPAYRGVTTIVSLQQAVARLGLRLLSEIALSATMKGSVFDVRGHRPLARHLWRTAYATALVGKEIARGMRHNVEAAFLCGLLHDFGAPVVLRTAILAAEAIDVPPPREAELVRMITELSADVGLRMAEKWHMPSRVCVAIRHYRQFADAGPHRHDAAATALARTIADQILSDDDDDSLVRSHPAVAELDLYDDDLDAILASREAIETALTAVST